jgi:effector-binding domain-containing protein
MAALLITAGCGTTRAGYQSAHYQIVRSAGKFEVRDYPTLTVVETSMDGNGGNTGFGRLFRFISGSNEKEQKIAMTTPVLMSGDDVSRTMSFVLPSNLEAGRIPKPADASVSVRVIPQGRFAVLRFSGGRSALREAAALDRLKTWMATEGLSSSSRPVYGYFDPPWTPPFWRRNEVMLRIEPRTQ